MKRCSSCKHWAKVPGNPLDLGAPPRGECRAVPPQILMIGLTQQGQPVLQTHYPQLPNNWAACGLHQPAEALVINGTEVSG